MIWVALFFTLCMAAYAAMVLWAAWNFSRLPCEHLSEAEVPMISVIIAARNEAAHIPTLLESLAAQNYPAERFEVILIDDSSEDSTRAQAWLWTEHISQLRIIPSSPPPGTLAYKKAALSTGIATAKGDIILQTDADCQMGPHWLESIAAHFGPNTALVSGPVLLTHESKWLERLQSLEMMGLVALGAGAMAAGKPNLVNGANLAFRKDLFDHVGGYEGIDQVASGDDELLLQKFRKAGSYEYRFARCKHAIVKTPALTDWASLKSQRLRWVSKARYYQHRGPNVAQLVGFLAMLGVVVLLFLGLIESRWALLAGELFLIKCLADLPLMYFSANFFHRLPLLKKDYLRLQLTYLPYVIWVGVAGNLVNTYEWKGRTVR